MVTVALTFIRGIVRPTLTWLGLSSLVAMVFLGIAVPDWLQVMVSAMIGWWFADRTGHKDGK